MNNDNINKITVNIDKEVRYDDDCDDSDSDAIKVTIINMDGNDNGER